MIYAKAAWTSALLLMVAAFTACAAEDNGQEPPEVGALSGWDSAGVRIVTSPSKTLATVLPWVVDTIPNLELGQAERDPASQFHRISGIVGLPDGGLVVLNGGSQELRWFDAFGKYVRTTGGTGRGPGEFVDPLVIPQFEADSLLIFDRIVRAFTWVATDGSGTEALPSGGPLFVGTPQTAAGSRVLFRSGSGSGSCAPNEQCKVPVLLRWVDMTGTVADTLATQTARLLKFKDSGRPGMLYAGPLDQRGLAAAGPDGVVLEGDPQFELRQFDPTGRLITILRVDAPARQTPQDALNLYVQMFSNPDEMRRIYERMGLPEVVPAFQALRVDRLGWYWAELFRPSKGGPSEWLVFDRQGRARGVIGLPSGLEVYEIGEDYVLGRWLDELGVEYVRRHALNRRGD